VPAADRAALQIKSGTIDGLSIGFDPILTGEELRDGVKTRTLREVKLYEFSVVTFPAEDSARILLTPEQQARQAAERERQHKIIEVHTAAFEASDREHQVKTVAINLASLGRY
jgi:phage head maturation protease